MREPFTFRPLEVWPYPMTMARMRSRFRATYEDTLHLLRAELEHLHAEAVVLQLALRSDQIRNDGVPYSGARPIHPGVILTFVSRGEPMSFPCDTYPAWKCNLRAIACSLEALRLVDRHGVTRNREQYRGWTELPAGGSARPAPSVIEAAEYLCKWARRSGRAVVSHPNAVLADSLIRDRVIRAARQASHPDRAIGDHESFLRVQQAAEIVVRFFPG